ncbi:hypothetical protein [Photobacterium leiognathi]|uniref:hypothetical protein n=1 Tax=Photobacterium leiognathi TaxID=553611 RepID=UPI003AF40866
MIDLTKNKLSIAQYDDLLNLAILSNKKNTGKIKRLSPFIKNAYSDYDKIINHYHQEPTPSRLIKHKNTIEEFYTLPPVSIEKELSKIRKRKLSQCPFCGRPCKPRILDHFIPKSHWPEFSILRNNLVNQCSSCSSKKWNHYYCNTDKKAKFIHPYYSSLLKKVNFKFHFDTSSCSNIIGATIDLKIIISRSVCGRSRRRIRKHLDELDINKYALEYAKDKYEDILEDASYQEVDMVDRLKGDIKIANRKSTNHWDGRIFEAMLANADIKAYLDQNKP